MDLDKSQDNGTTPRAPQTHIRGMVPTPDFPLLSPTEARGDNMYRGQPSSIPPPDTALSCRLHGFPETCAL